MDRKIMISVILVFFSIIFLASSTFANPGPAPMVYHTLNQILDIAGNPVDLNNNNIIDWAEKIDFKKDSYTCNSNQGSGGQGRCTISLAHAPVKICFVIKFKDCRDCRYSISGNDITVYAYKERSGNRVCYCSIRCIY